MKKWITNALLLLIFMCGLGLLCYPTLSNWYNEQVGSYHIKTYQEAVDDTPYELYAAMLAEARAYNATLDAEKPTYISGKAENETYINTLALRDGIMGALHIEKIDVSLPIYHGTDEAVLQHAIGHLEGSALCTGQTGEHTVLTGHTGLPSAHLLTDLPKMEIGDTFTVHTLNEIYTYQVFNKVVVLPYEVDNLTPVTDKSLVTLVTCTPYGVNSHRLFVQGELIATETKTGDGTSTDGQQTLTPAPKPESEIPEWAQGAAMSVAGTTAETLRSITYFIRDLQEAGLWVPLLALLAVLALGCMVLYLLHAKKTPPQHYKDTQTKSTTVQPKAAPQKPRHYQ